MKKPRPELEFVAGAVGLDEAGRGPLAGPVVAAAVVLPEGFDCRGLDDSKKLTPEQRESLALRIREHALWSIVAVEADEIDRLNILEASMEAMRRALALLNHPYREIFVDGNRVPAGIKGEAVVKGDGKHACIAAASILAKTERDAIMRAHAVTYPQYGFELHFGYPTPPHLQILREIGPCPIHRRSYAPVQEALYQPCLIFAD